MDFISDDAKRLCLPAGYVITVPLGGVCVGEWLSMVHCRPEGRGWRKWGTEWEGVVLGGQAIEGYS